MTGQREEKPKQKQAPSDGRRARLGEELRANLLKRKAQARAREAGDAAGDETGQTGG